MNWCSYFRLKSDCSSAQVTGELEELAIGYRAFAKQEQTVQGVTVSTTVYYKHSSPGEPEWLGLLGVLGANELETGRLGSLHNALILVDYLGVRWVLTFGSAHTIAKKLRIENRFGKIAVSNGKREGEVRAISARVHGSGSKSRTEKRGSPGPTSVLEVPRQANMAASIAAKVNLGGVEHVASGSNAVRGAAPTSLALLVQNLSQLDRWWNGGIELDQELASIDKAVEITTVAQIRELDEARSRHIRQGRRELFSLCLDDEAIWECTLMEYKVNRQWLHLGVPDEERIFLALSSIDSELDPLSISYRASIPGGADFEGKLADNLAFELPGNAGESYFYFEQGAWFQVKDAWRTTLISDVNRLVQLSAGLKEKLRLPTYVPAETEDAYIERVAKQLEESGRGMKLHKSFPPGRDKLELCDLIVDEEYLLFLKRGSGRSETGDVVQQVLDSINALLDRDSGFLEWSEEQLQRKGWSLRDGDRLKSLKFVVVLLLGSQSRPPDRFVLRSMDALSRHLREVGKFQMQPRLVIA